jgi:hypothetical protein
MAPVKGIGELTACAAFLVVWAVEFVFAYFRKIRTISDDSFAAMEVAAIAPLPWL